VVSKTEVKVTQDFQALIDWKVGLQYQCELKILKCKYLLPNNTQDDVAKIIKESLNALKADPTLQGLLVILKTNNYIALCQTAATSISVLCCSHSFTQDFLEAFFENLVSVGITQRRCTRVHIFGDAKNFAQI